MAKRMISGIASCVAVVSESFARRHFFGERLHDREERRDGDLAVLAAEDLRDLECRRLGELIVAALARRLVGAPALEVGGVAEPHALEVLERGP